MSVENLLEDNRQLVLTVSTWDVNCKQYLPSLCSEETLRKTQQQLLERINTLEAELAALKQLP